MQRHRCYVTKTMKNMTFVGLEPTPPAILHTYGREIAYPWW